MNGVRKPKRIDTGVIGGGQWGLSVGYYLARRGLPIAILDANERIGDAWIGNRPPTPSCYAIGRGI